MGATWRPKSATVTSSVAWRETGADCGGVYVAVRVIGYVPFGAREFAVMLRLTRMPAETGLDAKVTVKPVGVPDEESESCLLKLLMESRLICVRMDLVR